MESMLDRFWYQKDLNVLHFALLPLEKVFSIAVNLRRWAFQKGWLRQHIFPVPVVVVGNIVVGGVGKTPLLMALAEFLVASGFKPGIVSRGYRSKTGSTPQIVTPLSSAGEVGDEPLMLAKRLQLPVVVCRNRVQAATTLLEHFECNVILSDDGLQHYALGRDLELGVIDGQRQFGNGHLLPVGPLREPLSRLQELDFVLSSGVAVIPNAHVFDIHPSPQLRQVKDPHKQWALKDLSQKHVHAVAGIAHPQRFFNTLRAAGLQITEHPFSDHHSYQLKDFEGIGSDERPCFMTEKDAVKCQAFARDWDWYLPIEVSLPKAFKADFLTALTSVFSLKKASI